MSEHVLRYLSVVRVPVRGIAWSPTGDALIHEDGTTFAFAVEVGQFLEGFAATKPVVHFSYVLHMLRMLGYEPGAEATASLAEAFRAAGRPLRNAGALCGLLCREVPSSPGAPDGRAIAHWLATSPNRALLAAHRPENLAAESPPLAAFDFAHLVIAALQEIPPDDIAHYLRHGAFPSPAGEPIARELLAAKPPSLPDRLAEIARTHDRLCGAVPLVNTLVSALTLPPRRQRADRLPTGGYADVITRGLPERLLPHQFALDGLEFVRRFAANELLYFRREEPHTRTREELVVLVDQGVRTWGLVRLALAAAVIALARQATRRGLSVKLATTARPTPLTDPLTVTPGDLTELLEGSDLTSHPGSALEAVLADPAETTRDVVLLTHPRSLTEPGVAAAARTIAGDSRLFAVGIDESGCVELSQIKHGRPVPIARCRVDLVAANRAKPIGGPKPTPVARTGWSGDGEPVPFPFRFGPMSKVLAMAFDADGERLLIACRPGMLYLSDLSDAPPEVLPRGMVNGRVLTQVEAVLGVRGGFVAAGTIDKQLVAVYYDLAARMVKAWGLGLIDGNPHRWYAVPHWHCVAVQLFNRLPSVVALDLDTGGVHPSGPSAALTTRARQAASEVSGMFMPPPWVVVRAVQNATESHKPPWLHLDRETGTMSVCLSETDPFQGRTITPIADGKPRLKNCWITTAQHAGGVLALDGSLASTLLLVSVADGATLCELPVKIDSPAFQLSPGGGLVAVQTDQSRVTVYRCSPAVPEVADVLPGKCHSTVKAEIGIGWLVIRIGSTAHVLKWGREPHGHFVASRRDGTELEKFVWGWVNEEHGAVATAARLPNAVRYDDSKRFIAGSDTSGFIGQDEAGPPCRLKLAVDRHGQIAVFHPSTDQLVAMFFVHRTMLEGWLPDGTRFGPSDQSGTVAAGLDRILTALRRAEATPEESCTFRLTSADG